MKAGADFEQASNTTAKNYAPSGRLGDAAENLEERAFAGSVASDNPQYLAALDLEADIPRAQNSST